jgi:hypothetical protein
MESVIEAHRFAPAAAPRLCDGAMTMRSSTVTREGSGSRPTLKYWYARPACIKFVAHGMSAAPVGAVNLNLASHCVFPSVC